jgi:hypothetical protein
VAGEYHPDSVSAGQIPSGIGGDGTKEAVRFPHKQPAAITGLAVGADGAAVIHAVQSNDCGAHQPMAGITIQMGDKTEPAIIVNILWIIQRHEYLGKNYIQRVHRIGTITSPPPYDIRGRGATRMIRRNDKNGKVERKPWRMLQKCKN